MKESHALQSGQSTKGGSLPPRRSRFFSWKPVLLARHQTPDFLSETEPFSSDRKANVPDPEMSKFLRQAILQLVSAKHGLNRFDAKAQLPDPEEILLDTQFPKWKRIVDLGILICMVWLWLPLTLLVMCAVKLASSGPSFYRQPRIGYRGKTFTIYKFRTMHVSAETRSHEEYLAKLMAGDAPMTKLDASDPRLVPGGRFLRATGLDELPQIFNVIRGDMSLVGPRPCTLAEFQRYRPEHRGRISAPPGITGLWQVNGKNKTSFSEMVAMDVFYAKNMSFWLDLAIIGRTIPAIVRQMRDRSAPAEIDG
jgi:lipopolysaccharide/colanic/teichoic acid biosynthesis glycosyltransferase